MTSPQTVEEIIAGFERDLTAAMARRDVDECARRLSDDYSLVEATTAKSLQVVLREGWLNRLKKGECAMVTLDDIIVATHGTAAVAIVLLTHAAESGAEGVQSVATDVWRQEQTGWKIVQRHWSRPR